MRGTVLIFVKIIFYKHVLIFLVEYFSTSVKLFQKNFCTPLIPSSMDRTSQCNKVDAVRLYASYRLNLRLLKKQRCVVELLKHFIRFLYEDKFQVLHDPWPVNGLKGTAENLVWHSLHDRSSKIALTVPLTVVWKMWLKLTRL